MPAPRTKHPDWKMDRIREMWAKGDSLSAIGRATHLTKDAVGSLVKRMDLPPRANPVKPSRPAAPVLLGRGVTRHPIPSLDQLLSERKP